MGTFLTTPGNVPLCRASTNHFSPSVIKLCPIYPSESMLPALFGGPAVINTNNPNQMRLKFKSTPAPVLRGGPPRKKKTGNQSHEN